LKFGGSNWKKTVQPLAGRRYAADARRVPRHGV